MNRREILSQLIRRPAATISIVVGLGLLILVGSAAAVNNYYTLTISTYSADQGMGRATSTPLGINCDAGVAGSDCSEGYHSNDTVTLQASPSQLKYFFFSYAGDLEGITNPITFLMGNNNRTVWVDFGKPLTPTVYLENIRAPDASPADWARPANWKRSTLVRHNEDMFACLNPPDYCLVKIGAPAFFDADGDKDFDLFIGHGSDLSFYRNVVSSPPDHSLTVKKAGTGSGIATSSNPTGDIICGSLCFKAYKTPTDVTLTAEADHPRSVFAGWSGACTNSTGDCLVNVNGHKTVIATFNRMIDDDTTFLLKVEKDGTGVGTVTGPGINCGLDCQERYVSGTTVPLAANPALGSVFASWSDDDDCAAAGTDPACEIVMDADKTVTATFNDNGDPIEGDGKTCPANTNSAGWKPPKYASPECLGGSEFDPGCYPPINQSTVSQSKAGCLSVGNSNPDDPDAGGLFVDAGAYVSGFLKLLLTLRPEEIERQKKVGNVLTLTETDADRDGAPDGVASWEPPALDCYTNSIVATTNSDIPWDWETATSTCAVGYTVTDGWIKMALANPR